MSKNALYLAIFGILCVLLGVLVGANLAKMPPLPWPSAEKTYFREKAERFMGHKPRHPADKRSGKGFVEILAVKLNLDAEQKATITQILENTRLKIDEVGKDIRSAIAEIKQEADKQIMGILTPQQQEQFKALRKEFKRGREFKKSQGKYMYFRGDKPQPEGELPPLQE